MAVNGFMIGLSDPRLIEHMLSQKPANLADCERMALEFIQLRKSVRPTESNRQSRDPNPRENGGRRDRGVFPVKLNETFDVSVPYINSADLFSPEVRSPDTTQVEASLLVDSRKVGAPQTRSQSVDSHRPPANMMPPNQARPRPVPQIKSGSNSPARVPLSEIKCYRCQQLGHTAKYCQIAAKCYSCGQTGHMKWQCPSAPVSPRNLPRPPDKPNTVGQFSPTVLPKRPLNSSRRTWKTGQVLLSN